MQETKFTAKDIASTEFPRLKNLDPIQNNCKYGWVLPDRCRYNARLGCDCGAYPPIPVQNLSLQEQGCTWPDCQCKVPDWAFSQDIRKKFCEALIDKNTLKEYNT